MKGVWYGLLLLAISAFAGPCTGAQPDTRRSGLDDMTPALQALQRDDAQNPAALWLTDGEQRFSTACSACHTPQNLRGVAARYPALDTGSSKPVTLSQRINLCRQRHGQAPAYAAESSELLGLATYLGSLQRRLRGCMTGLRAAPYASDADEFTALELYLMQRAAGMRIETPAVRP